jgi:hypothetical protein
VPQLSAPRRAHLSTSTSLRSCPHRAAPASPKVWVLSHRNLIAGAEASVTISATPLMMSSSPRCRQFRRQVQPDHRFYVGAHVVLVNYLLPEEVVRLCAKHGITGLAGVPPLDNSPKSMASRSHAEHALLRHTGGRMPEATLGCAQSSRMPSYHVRPCGGIPFMP